MLTLKFKGERKYLQGPDIYNEALIWLTNQRSEVRDIDFAFHRMATRQVKAVLADSDTTAEAVAACAFTSERGRERLLLLETDQAVSDAYPYPEDELVRPMAVELATRTGLLRGTTVYSDIEIWVAMTKALHHQVFPDLPGKWLFVRARFPHFRSATAAAERKLAITACFNNKLTRSEAFLDGSKAGEIYFSIV
ncbi:MAG TPA: hypothetical protein VI279_14915 [Rhodocyclaceae bacterium]